jgi:tetratricopeptide (TPR) repeat protein
VHTASVGRPRAALVWILVLGVTPGVSRAQFGGQEEPSAFDKMKAAISAPFKRDPAKESVEKAQRQEELKRRSDPTSLSYQNAKPLTADFYVSLARNQERSGNVKAAEAQYRQALELDPNHFDALLDYARLQDRQGNFSAAIALYSRAASRRPNDPAVQNDMGLCHARQGQFPQAVERLKKAIQLSPERTKYRNNLATVLVETGRIDEAYQQMAAVHKPSVAHYNLGFLLSQADQIDAAMRQFELALRDDPDFAPARQWLDYLAGYNPEDAGSTAYQEPQVPVTRSAAAPDRRYETRPPQQQAAPGAPDVTRPWRSDARQAEPIDEGPALEAAAYELPSHWAEPPPPPTRAAQSLAQRPRQQPITRTPRVEVASPNDELPPTPESIKDDTSLRFGENAPQEPARRYYPPSRY